MPELSDIRVLVTGDDEADLAAVRTGLHGTVEVVPGLSGAVAAMRLREFGALVADVQSVQDALVLLRAARADAATGLLDVRRLGMMLERIRGRIIHKPLDRVSPLSVSVMLEIGRERVYSDNADEILAEAEAALLDEALA